MGIKEIVNANAETLIGQILTQIESSISSESQCKAVKSIVKKIMWEKFNSLTDELERPGKEIN